MQEIVILTFCDNCYQNGPTVPVGPAAANGQDSGGPVKTEACVTVSVSIGDASARLDLCEHCDHALLASLRQLVSTRAAAQQALDKSTRADAAIPEQRDGTGVIRVSRGRSRGKSIEGGGQRADQSVPAARCGECHATVQLRYRGRHARQRHQREPERISWDFGPEVTTVWVCDCGLPFPTQHGLTTHARRTGHQSATDPTTISQPAVLELPMPSS